MRSAVSARPLRAPWVEMKYSSTDRPSMKLALIGRSMISPFGLAIRPRMPASWRICLNEPRAPELAIMKIGLSSSRFATIASATSSVAAFHCSTTASWRSSWVIRPVSYWSVISATSASYLSRISCFSGGTTTSFLEIVMPACVAYLKPEVLERVEHQRDRRRAVASARARRSAASCRASSSTG